MREIIKRKGRTQPILLITKIQLEGFEFQMDALETTNNGSRLGLTDATRIPHQKLCIKQCLLHDWNIWETKNTNGFLPDTPPPNRRNFFEQEYRGRSGSVSGSCPRGESIHCTVLSHPKWDRHIIILYHTVI